MKTATRAALWVIISRRRRARTTRISRSSSSRRVIAGVTSSNVVPGHCRIVAEARSLGADRAAAVAGELTEACAWGASERGLGHDV